MDMYVFWGQEYYTFSYPWHLTQNLAYFRTSINIYWMFGDYENISHWTMVLESEPHSQQKKRIGEQIRETGIQQTHRNGPGTNKTKNKKKMSDSIIWKWWHPWLSLSSEELLSLLSSTLLHLIFLLLVLHLYYILNATFLNSKSSFESFLSIRGKSWVIISLLNSRRILDPTNNCLKSWWSPVPSLIPILFSFCMLSRGNLIPTHCFYTSNSRSLAVIYHCLLNFKSIPTANRLSHVSDRHSISTLNTWQKSNSGASGLRWQMEHTHLLFFSPNYIKIIKRYGHTQPHPTKRMREKERSRDSNKVWKSRDR